MDYEKGWDWMEKKEIFDQLSKQINPENILLDEPMSKHTSFRIGGPADIFIRAKSKEEMKCVLQFAKEKNISVTVMGNGTNLLVRDKGIRGIVVKPEIRKIEVLDTELIVGAGNTLAEIANVALGKSLSGFEFASGIPGTVGGAIKMNAGAHGREMKDVVVSVTCLTEDLETVTLPFEKLGFGYRTSNFFSKYASWIVLEAKLRLICGNETDISGLMQEYANYRKEKQPIQYPSAGSTFKRGDGYITAQLIDLAGLKGASVGDAQISTLHAGFIINKGSATAKDVLSLVKMIREKIQSEYGKTIELEIQVLGEE